MNKCQKCNNIVPNDARVCPFCGNSLQNIVFNPGSSSGLYYNQPSNFGNVPQYGQSEYQSGQYVQTVQTDHYNQLGQPMQHYNQPGQYGQSGQYSQVEQYDQGSYNTYGNQQYNQFSNTSYTGANYYNPINKNNTSNILAILSIVMGGLSIPACLFAICGIIFSLIGLILGIFSMITEKDDKTIKLLAGIGIGLSSVGLFISCINSIWGILQGLGIYY